MDTPNLSILIPTCGRSSLAETVASVTAQLRPGDQLIIDRNDDPWGNRARNRMMRQAWGDAIAFMDDDDEYRYGALDAMRAGFAAAPNRVHLFRMRYDNGRVLWKRQSVEEGNVSTQMVVVPNTSELGEFGDRRAGDFDFIRSTCERLGSPIWHTEEIALIRT